jgi:hypothetical protein
MKKARKLIANIAKHENKMKEKKFEKKVVFLTWAPVTDHAPATTRSTPSLCMKKARKLIEKIAKHENKMKEKIYTKKSCIPYVGTGNTD